MHTEVQTTRQVKTETVLSVSLTKPRSIYIVTMLLLLHSICRFRYSRGGAYSQVNSYESEVESE